MQHQDGVPTGPGPEKLFENAFKEGFEESDIFARSKTSLRMHYEAQVAVIQKQSGSLEEIRTKLGLSNRKMAQLLMIDPSSWTRWTRSGENRDEAPPHIWRALQWYLILREKIPGLTPQYFVGQDPQTLHQKALAKIDEEKSARIKLEIHFESQLQNLQKKMRFYRVFFTLFLCTSLVLSILLLFKV